MKYIHDDGGIGGDVGNDVDDGDVGGDVNHDVGYDVINDADNHVDDANNHVNDDVGSGVGGCHPWHDIPFFSFFSKKDVVKLLSCFKFGNYQIVLYFFFF